MSPHYAGLEHKYSHKANFTRESARPKALKITTKTIGKEKIIEMVHYRKKN